MSTFNIKVTEYGFKRGRIVKPEHYNWDYCVNNQIPYIYIEPGTKYSIIDYDLMPIDDGISFEPETLLSDYMEDYYKDYIRKSNLPENKVYSPINSRLASFRIFKGDQIEAIQFVMSKIEEFVNNHGIVRPEFKEYFRHQNEPKSKRRELTEFNLTKHEEIPIEEFENDFEDFKSELLKKYPKNQ